jgi:hypothetical protein
VFALSFSFLSSTSILLIIQHEQVLDLIAFAQKSIFAIATSILIACILTPPRGQKSSSITLLPQSLPIDTMARLLAWTSLVAGAFATMHEMSGSSYGGSSYGGSQTVEIQIGITLISSCMGGGAPMNTMAPPPMAMTGMTHQVCTNNFQIWAGNLQNAGYCGW